MRDVKYRCYDDFIKGFAFFDKGKTWYYSNGKRFENAHMFDWNKAEEYTGLKDKNGKEIYEGDIVQLPQPYIKPIQVYWNVEMTGFYPLLSERGNKLEIIGNIHETPELLDAQK